MLYFVYGLIDPQTNAIGYVGMTNNPNRRFVEHIELKDVAGKRKKDWVKGLLDLGMKPKLRILETVEGKQEAYTREKYWIQYYLSQGIALVNAQSTKEKLVKEKKEKPVKIRRKVTRIEDMHVEDIHIEDTKPISNDQACPYDRQYLDLHYRQDFTSNPWYVENAWEAIQAQHGYPTGAQLERLLKIFVTCYSNSIRDSVGNEGISYVKNWCKQKSMN